MATVSTEGQAKLGVVTGGSLIAAVLGVGLPLEFLRQLPGLLHYLAPWQALVVLAELGLIFGLGSMAVAVPLGLACEAAGRVRREAGHLVAAVIVRGFVLVFLLHAARAWAQAVGLLDVGSAASRPWVWVAMLLVGVAAIGWRTIRSPGPICPAGVRRGACITGLLLTVGLAIRLAYPLHATHAMGASTERTRPTPGTHPDVVLITIDTLSAAHMSLYGYRHDTTPHLNVLASTSTVFERFYANSNFTTAGVSSMMLGTRPWTHGAVLAPSTPQRSSDAASMLGQFHQAGYQVLAVSTNPWASPAKLELLRHVDEHIESHPWRHTCRWDLDAQVARIVSPQTASLLGVAGYWAPWRLRLMHWAINTGRCPPSGHFNPYDALHSALQAWHGAAHGGRPILLWVHLTPPHDPYAPPPPFIGLFDPRPQARRIDDSSPHYHHMPEKVARTQNDRLQGRYDEAIRYVDHSVGAFIDSLRRSSRLDSSLIVVSADHGESFGHNYGAHGGPELFEDVIRIPLLIRLPGQTTPLRAEAPAEQVDLWPTLAELAGLSGAPAPDIEGRSLAPTVRGQPQVERPVFSITFERQPHRRALAPGTVTLVEGRWKLHCSIDQQGARHRPSRLFDVVDDPGELRDLAGLEPETVSRLQSLVDAELVRRRAAP